MWKHRQADAQLAVGLPSTTSFVRRLCQHLPALQCQSARLKASQLGVTAELPAVHVCSPQHCWSASPMHLAGHRA
jgi:hypothetical protein